ncbi:MAG: transposase [Comamonadaceae bacterium]|nr:transposase [Comamonadaceae bacterium]
MAFDGFACGAVGQRAVDAARGEARGEHWLKKPAGAGQGQRGRWTPKERDKMDDAHTRLKTARAWRLEESCATSTKVRNRCDRMHAVARGGCTGPSAALGAFKELARTIRQHWSGIVKAFDAAGFHGLCGGGQLVVAAAKAKARGYGTTDHFIAMAFLIAGKLTRPSIRFRKHALSPDLHQNVGATRNRREPKPPNPGAARS